jgi:two-component system cell cycle sensor histidine kinase/response regulator CckA
MNSETMTKQQLLCELRALRERVRELETAELKRAQAIDIAEHKRAQEEMRLSNQRLELLAETSSLLLRSDSPQEVIDSLCQKVLVFLNCDTFFNYIVDHEKQRLHLNACNGIPQEDVQRMEWLDYGVGLCGCSARDGKRLVVENLQDLDDQYSALVRPFGIQAYACHPLISQGRVLGTLSFCRRTRAPFTDDELSIMKSVADQVSIAIDRKQSAERVERSEKKFRAVFENAHDAIFLLGEDLSFLDCNPAATKMFECAKSKIVGRTPLDFMPPAQPDGSDSKQKAREIGNVLLQGNAPYFEWLCQRSDGAQFEAIIVANRFELDDEVVTLAIVRDISARKRSEVALRESEARFRGFMDNSPAIAWMKDEEGRYVYLSKSYQKRLGVRFSDLEGKTDFDIWPQHIAKQFRENDLVVMDSGNPIELPEESIDLKGEHTFWWNSKFLIRDSAGRGFVCGIGIDLTLQKKLENELRASETRFRALVEATSDSIWEVDENEIYTYASPKIYDHLGYQPTEVIGKTLYDFVIPEEVESLQRKLDAYKRERKPFFTLEKESMSKSGEKVILETSGVPILDMDGNFYGYRGIDRNISERKMLEQKFLQAQKMEVVGQLASGIAHDFNNIVMAIEGYVELLLPRMANDSNCKKYMKRIDALARRANTLTRDLLMFSRKQGVDPKAEDLNMIVRRMKDILRWLIGDDIRFKMSLHQGVLPIMSVSGQIEQVLTNIVTNARDATPKGGLITLRTSLIDKDSDLFKPAEFAKVRGYALISVDDTGSGMDRTTSRKIFEPFFSLKEVGKGTGLGLAVVYGIVKQHNGFINVESKQGMGTTFNIYIPLIDAMLEN